MQFVEASAIIRAGIVALSESSKKRAVEFKHTPIIGRTHGIHAEPTTFGLKLLLWYSEMQRNLTRFDAAAEDLRVGKLSGAVGTFGHLKPEHEEAICAEFGLRPVAVATQVLQRDRHAAYIATLAVLCSTLDKIATEIRHLQRTEVREAEEFFSEKQKGSSAMPHKRNPITSEQISGLARVIRANAQVALENIALWHERDISHSSAERVILPDSTILADYLLAKTTNLIEKLLVYPARMLKNLESTGGLIFSGQLLLDLAESGMTREDAYRLVQSHAMNAWKNELNFRDEIAKVPEITARLTPEKLARSIRLQPPALPMSMPSSTRVLREYRSFASRIRSTYPTVPLRVGGIMRLPPVTMIVPLPTFCFTSAAKKTGLLQAFAEDLPICLGNSERSSSERPVAYDCNLPLKLPFQYRLPDFLFCHSQRSEGIPDCFRQQINRYSSPVRAQPLDPLGIIPSIS